MDTVIFGGSLSILVVATDRSVAALASGRRPSHPAWSRDQEAVASAVAPGVKQPGIGRRRTREVDRARTVAAASVRGITAAYPIGRRRATR
jgi:hypothetical protein